MKIAAICGWGLGTSIMLKCNIEEILDKHGIKAKVFSWDAMSYKSQGADIIVAAEEFKNLLKDSQATVVLVKYITNSKEVEEKILQAIKNLSDKNK